MDQQQKEPTRGAKFLDTKYSPLKFITTDDDRGFKSGDVVFIGSSDKVYGPYQLDTEIGKGNGQIHWKAFSISATTRSKPLTKDELEKENARKDAQIAEMQQQLQELMNARKK